MCLRAARHQAAAGDSAAVRRLLGQSRREAREELVRLYGWFVVWPEWIRFDQACSLEGWSWWIRPAGLLTRRVIAAQSRLEELAGKAARLGLRAASGSDAGEALEDLLVQVWRCEDEWRLDDRIDSSPRSPRT